MPSLMTLKLSLAVNILRTGVNTLKSTPFWISTYLSGSLASFCIFVFIVALTFLWIFVFLFVSLYFINNSWSCCYRSIETSSRKTTHPLIAKSISWSVSMWSACSLKYFPKLCLLHEKSKLNVRMRRINDILLIALWMRVIFNMLEIIFIPYIINNIIQ